MLVASLLALAQTKFDSTTAVETRAEVLTSIGFKFYDALRIAFAEAASVNVMLITDDCLLRKALKCKSDLGVTPHCCGWSPLLRPSL